MAKNKSLKSESTLSKRKKLSSITKEDHAEEMMDAEGKKKRKKTEVEVVSAELPHVTVTAGDKKIHKKLKKKQMAAQNQQNKISDPPGRPGEAPEQEKEEDLSPEEKRTLERKMKKILKKEAQRKLKAAGETQQKTEASAPAASQQALDYLMCWAENRTEWKFQKTRQTWLLQNMFDLEKFPDEKFCVLLQYLDGLRGGARDTTVQKALALIEESGKVPDDVVVQKRAHRAREVIQLLS